MCPHTWQDQFNLHKKGGALVDMCLLLLCLEAIERVCGQEISNKSNASRDEKASHSKKCGQERSKKSVASCNKKPSHSNRKGYVATWY
jgi:hypothetical protein